MFQLFSSHNNYKSSKQKTEYLKHLFHAANNYCGYEQGRPSFTETFNFAETLFLDECVTAPNTVVQLSPEKVMHFQTRSLFSNIS
jgi:hypothetical protein